MKFSLTLLCSLPVLLFAQANQLIQANFSNVNVQQQNNSGDQNNFYAQLNVSPSANQNSIYALANNTNVGDNNSVSTSNVQVSNDDVNPLYGGELVQQQQDDIQIADDNNDNQAAIPVQIQQQTKVGVQQVSSNNRSSFGSRSSGISSGKIKSSGHHRKHSFRKFMVKQSRKLNFMKRSSGVKKHFFTDKCFSWAK